MSVRLSLSVDDRSAECVRLFGYFPFLPGRLGSPKTFSFRGRLSCVVAVVVAKFYYFQFPLESFRPSAPRSVARVVFSSLKTYDLVG